MAEPVNPTPPANPNPSADPNPPANPNPPADPNPPTPPANPNPPADPNSPANPNPPTDPAKPAATVAVPKSLLDDADDTPANPADPGTPTDEAVKAFVEGIPALDLGDGVKWDDEMLTAMAPSLMELTGADPKKADGIVKAYAAHAQKIAKAQAEAADAFNNGLIQQCQERFGADLKKVAGYAKQGGLEVFGEKIWNEMKKIPAFANNPDIMDRLAAIGRKKATDGGKVVPKAAAPADRGDLLHRMYGQGAK